MNSDLLPINSSTTPIVFPGTYSESSSSKPSPSPIEEKTSRVASANLTDLTGTNSELNRDNVNYPTSAVALPLSRQQNIEKITVENGITPGKAESSSSQNTVVNEDFYAKNSTIIQDVLDKDKEDLNIAIELFDKGDVKLTENNTELSNSCVNLIKDNEKLFSDPEGLKQEWDVFVRQNPDVSGTPTFNLDGKGYHNIGHAKEMFYDTYETLFNEGYPESTCMAGATMAFFHDLIQGIDGFPQLGKNEALTSKFLAHLIDKNKAMQPAIIQAIKTLADATIVGGTFLLKVKNEKGEAKNMALCELMDQQKTGTSPSLAILKIMRATLAFNDISRTTSREVSTTREKNGLMQSISKLKAESSTSFPEKIEGNPIAAQLFKNHGKALVSRLFQSIRMQTEFPAWFNSSRFWVTVDMEIPLCFEKAIFEKNVISDQRVMLRAEKTWGTVNQANEHEIVLSLFP